MTIKAVIFDIGNVLIEWQPERYYDAKIGEARRRAMFAQLDLHGMNDVIDRGGDFRGTVYDWAEKTPDWGEEIRLWHDDWLEMAKPAIPGPRDAGTSSQRHAGPRAAQSSAPGRSPPPPMISWASSTRPSSAATWA